MNKSYFANIILLLAASLLQAQPIAKPMLYLGATIHTGTGTVIPDGALTVSADTILFVGDAQRLRIDPAAFDTIIDVTGKHIWPGFIALNTTIGLREIDAVRATNDYAETGELNPNVRSLPAYNTDSKIIPTLRSNGVLTVQSVPRSGLVSGRSSLFRMQGWNWEDAVHNIDEGLHINWPQSSYQPKPGDTTRHHERVREKIRQLQRLMEDARAYRAGGTPAQRNLKLEAMQGIFTGAMALYLYADQARDIVDAVEFAAGFSIPRIVLVGGDDSWRVTDVLKRHNVAVILSNIHRLPDNADEPVDLPFRLPLLLTEAGLTVALCYGPGRESGTRNLGFLAGTAAAYGMDKEKALQLITLNPAKITGIDRTDGSLETGKQATFFITAGDALDMRTAAVEAACIDGVPADLDNHQKALYRRYREKYGVGE